MVASNTSVGGLQGERDRDPEGQSTIEPTTSTPPGVPIPLEYGQQRIWLVYMRFYNAAIHKPFKNKQYAKGVFLGATFVLASIFTFPFSLSALVTQLSIDKKTVAEKLNSVAQHLYQNYRDGGPSAAQFLQWPFVKATQLQELLNANVTLNDSVKYPFKAVLGLLPSAGNVAIVRETPVAELAGARTQVAVTQPAELNYLRDVVVEQLAIAKQIHQGGDFEPLLSFVIAIQAELVIAGYQAIQADNEIIRVLHGSADLPFSILQHWNEHGRPDEVTRLVAKQIADVPHMPAVAESSTEVPDATQARKQIDALKSLAVNLAALEDTAVEIQDEVRTLPTDSRQLLTDAIVKLFEVAPEYLADPDSELYRVLTNNPTLQGVRARLLLDDEHGGEGNAHDAEDPMSKIEAFINNITFLNVFQTHFAALNTFVRFVIGQMLKTDDSDTDKFARLQQLIASRGRYNRHIIEHTYRAGRRDNGPLDDTALNELAVFLLGSRDNEGMSLFNHRQLLSLCSQANVEAHAAWNASLNFAAQTLSPVAKKQKAPQNLTEISPADMVQSSSEETESKPLTSSNVDQQASSAAPFVDTNVDPTGGHDLNETADETGLHDFSSTSIMANTEIRDSEVKSDADTHLEGVALHADDDAAKASKSSSGSLNAFLIVGGSVLTAVASPSLSSAFSSDVTSQLLEDQTEQPGASTSTAVDMSTQQLIEDSQDQTHDVGPGVVELDLSAVQEAFAKQVKTFFDKHAKKQRGSTELAIPKDNFFNHDKAHYAVLTGYQEELGNMVANINGKSIAELPDLFSRVSTTLAEHEQSKWITTSKGLYTDALDFLLTQLNPIVLQMNSAQPGTVFIAKPVTVVPDSVQQAVVSPLSPVTRLAFISSAIIAFETTGTDEHDIFANPTFVPQQEARALSLPRVAANVESNTLARSPSACSLTKTPGSVTPPKL